MSTSSQRVKNKFSFCLFSYYFFLCFCDDFYLSFFMCHFCHLIYCDVIKMALGMKCGNIGGYKFLYLNMFSWVQIIICFIYLQLTLFTQP